MLTFIISSTCLKTLFPEGSGGSDSSHGPVHGLSLLPPAGLLPLFKFIVDLIFRRGRGWSCQC